MNDSIWKLSQCSATSSFHAAIDLVVAAGFLPSKSEAKRLVQQGGLTINDKKVAAFDEKVTVEDFGDDGLVAKRGKKAYLKITLK